MNPIQVKAEKALLKEALLSSHTSVYGAVDSYWKNQPVAHLGPREFKMWTIQFRKNHYTVNIKHKIPFVRTAEQPFPPAKDCEPLTAEQQAFLEGEVAKLNLSYPVKIIGK
jgi:hypothetical protein